MFRLRRTVLGAFALTLGLALILAWAAGPGARAQDESPGAYQAPLEPKAPLGTAFTYQGQLTDDGSPATGPCDLRFSLFDAASDGAQLGSTLTQTGVELSDGRFTAVLDFGVGVFTGDARWLEIAVQCPGDSGYATLGRTALKAAPYALYASAAPWGGLRNVPADLADGDDDTTYSAGTGLALSGTKFSVSTPYRLPQACGNGQIAEWNGSAWACGDDITAVYAGTGLTGGGTSGDVTLNADTDYLQRRVGDSCSSGNAIRAISITGGVTCQSVIGGNDHNHLGQTWTGTDNPLRIEGSFGSPDYASLVISNSHILGDGLRVESAGIIGVYVDSAGTDAVHVDTAGGNGVYVGRAGWDGVKATSTSASNYGGRFFNNAAGGVALFAEGGSSTAADVILGGSSARIRSDPNVDSSDMLLISDDAIFIELDSDNDESGNLWVQNGDDETVFSVNESGDTWARGTKGAAVQTQTFGQRKLYAVESPEVWFEDFGTGQLVDGQATVEIEPVFAQTVILDPAGYHVFLTPLGDCPLYVAEKTPTSFTVQAIGGQTCVVAFDYRIVAKRLGYEDLRLEAVTLGADGESGE